MRERAPPSRSALPGSVNCTNRTVRSPGAGRPAGRSPGTGARPAADSSRTDALPLRGAPSRSGFDNTLPQLAAELPPRNPQRRIHLQPTRAGRIPLISEDGRGVVAAFPSAAGSTQGRTHSPDLWRLRSGCGLRPSACQSPSASPPGGTREDARHPDRRAVPPECVRPRQLCSSARNAVVASPAMETRSSPTERVLTETWTVPGRPMAAVVVVPTVNSG